MLSSTFRCTFRTRLHYPTQSLFRQYASAPKASRPLPRPGIAKTASPSKLPSLNTPRTKEDISKLMRVELAEKIFSSGQKELYRAPRRLTIFRVNSWILASLLFGTVFGYGFNRLLDPEEARRRGFSTWITTSYWAVSFALCMFGFLVMIRTRGHIEAVDLVKKKDSVFVQIRTRSMIPFRKLTTTVPPYDVHIGREIVLMVDTPEYMRPIEGAGAPEKSRSVITAPLRAISRFFYSILSAGRQFFAQDGILKIAIADQGTKEKKGYSVDVDGSWYKQQGKQLPAFFEIGMMDDELDVDRLS